MNPHVSGCQKAFPLYPAFLEGSQTADHSWQQAYLCRQPGYHSTQVPQTVASCHMVHLATRVVVPWVEPVPEPVGLFVVEQDAQLQVANIPGAELPETQRGDPLN